MSVFIIGDLHLSFDVEKPMDIFGENWKNHELKIKEDWESKVRDEDTVFLLGDFSWAMTLEEARKDFEFINELPGKKVLLKGNHDYWWTTVTGMKRYLEENGMDKIEFLQNNSFLCDEYAICGTRGWQLNDEENKKIINRELIRLEMSLENAKNKVSNDEKIIVCMHYPPIMKNVSKRNMEFINLMKKYDVKKCFFGHLHGTIQNEAFEGNFEGIEFKLISADYLDFKLVKL